MDWSPGTSTTSCKDAPSAASLSLNSGALRLEVLTSKEDDLSGSSALASPRASDLLSPKDAPVGCQTPSSCPRPSL